MRPVVSAFRTLAALALFLTIACPALADDFHDGLLAYDRGDFKAALEIWRPLANEGDARAQYLIGTMYAKGEGAPRDLAEALKWFRVAAEGGDANAQFYLGSLYDKGLGVDQDMTEAVKWYRMAADQGDGGAQLFLGMLYSEGDRVKADPVQGLAWLILAARNFPPGDLRRLAETRALEVSDKVGPKLTGQAESRAKAWKKK